MCPKELAVNRVKSWASTMQKLDFNEARRGNAGKLLQEDCIMILHAMLQHAATTAVTFLTATYMLRRN